MSVYAPHFGRGELRQPHRRDHALSLQAVLVLAEVIRHEWGPVKLTSTYRPGDPGQHGQGEAIDLAPLQVDRLEVLCWLLDLATMGCVLWDQLIVYEDTGHLHLSWDRTRPMRGEVRVGVPAGGGSRLYPRLGDYRGHLLEHPELGQRVEAMR